MTRRRALAVVVLVVVAIVAVAFALPGSRPFDPDEAGPEGTLALRRLLDRLGVDHRDADAPGPATDTFVLLRDLRSDDAAADLLDWVAAGGRLVLADPSSTLADRLGVETAGIVGGTPGGTDTLEPGCLIPELGGVSGVRIRFADPLLAVPAADVLACLPSGRDAYLLVVAHGSGRVLVLGGASPFTNELLRDADNAVLAVGLVGDGPVVFGTPRPAGTAPVGVWSALPGPARAALVGVLAAVLAYAAARARRLGLTPAEEPLAPIPASALVVAVAGVYRSAADRKHTAGLLRTAAADRIRARLGLPRATSRAEVARLAAAVASRPEAPLRTLLDRTVPRDDDGLLRLAGELDDVVAQVAGVHR